MQDPCVLMIFTYIVFHLWNLALLFISVGVLMTIV
jgi:hypothetical protein